MDYSHANEIHVSPFIVRGIERTMEITMPTTLKTIEQVPCSVTVFIMTRKVRIWLPMTKIKNKN